MIHILDLAAWMAALDWTPETAATCVADLCVYLKDEHSSTWDDLAPSIGDGLTCLAGSPDELYRLALQVYDACPNASSNLLGRILAGVDAELPERLVLATIQNGCLIPILYSKSYTVVQRLSWLRGHIGYVIPQGGLGTHDGALEEPIKTALMLWFFMEANKGALPDIMWQKAGMQQEFVSTASFLETHAPSIVKRIDMVKTLGLSYHEAFDMLIDDGEKLALPGLDETNERDFVSP
jgi:hypothetical protein